GRSGHDKRYVAARSAAGSVDSAQADGGAGGGAGDDGEIPVGSSPVAAGGDGRAGRGHHCPRVSAAPANGVDINVVAGAAAKGGFGAHAGHGRGGGKVNLAAHGGDPGKAHRANTGGGVDGEVKAGV